MTLKQDDFMSLENDLFKRYPKMAIQGKDLVGALDTDWKKGFVGFMAAALAGVEVTRKAVLLGDQLSDSFNEIMAKELPAKWDKNYEAELKIIFRIKNFFASGYEIIVPFVKETDALLMASKKKLDVQLSKGELVLPKDAGLIMNQDFYNYYVAAKATLFASQDENLALVKGIDETLPKCFAEAVREGVDFKALEASALEGNTTREQLKEILAKVIQSTGLDVKV